MHVPSAGKSSFAFAFYMDRAKEERERGVTIACTTKEFFTEKWHYVSSSRDADLHGSRADIHILRQCKAVER